MIRQFKNFLENEKLITKLIKHYNPNLINERYKKQLEFMDNIIENLNEIDINQINQNYDIIAKSYESLKKHKERKLLGEFYTPLSIVDYILDRIGYNFESKIEERKLIDISCGTGSFLIQAIKILIKRYLKTLNRETIHELKAEESKNIIETIQGNIFGIDINPISCILCQVNIYFVLFDLIQKIQKSDKNFQVPVFHIENYNALKIDILKQYDFVVGNPPYLFIRDIPDEHRKIIESGSFTTNEGQYDYYQLFIEIGIRLLNKDGKLGFIVPDSILALSNREIIRKFIYDTTKIIEIYYTGPKFDDPVVSNIILILEREINALEREKNKIRIRLVDEQEKQILQETLKKWDYKFLIHLSDTDISIMEHLSKNFTRLTDINKKEGFKISLSRGVELAKTGEIIFCKRCGLYYPVPKKYLKCPECKSELKAEHIESIIYDKIPEERKGDFKPFLYGINRYEIKDNKFIDTSKDGINYKDLEIYDDRIIIRQLSQNNLICATYEGDLSITSQSFYNLKIMESPVEEFNHLYLLGIINSKLLSYFFIQSFGSYKKLFPRILIEKIKILPIKVPESNEDIQKAVKISEHVKTLLTIQEKNSELFDKTQDKVNSLIFDLYQISKEHRAYIVNFMKNTEKL
jgi:hypothetical protein